jgi:hypothetical protein
MDTKQKCKCDDLGRLNLYENYGTSINFNINWEASCIMRHEIWRYHQVMLVWPPEKFYESTIRYEEDEKTRIHLLELGKKYHFLPTPQTLTCAVKYKRMDCINDMCRL